MKPKHILLLGTLSLALAVLIGAFGAHGLKALVTPEKLATFETGVRYHFYHGLGLILLGLHSPKTTKPAICFSAGILLFSFNCYIYVLTNFKIFALIVPVGGILFVAGWLLFAWDIYKSPNPFRNQV